MYPYPVKLDHAKGTSLWIDDELSSDAVSISIELESNGGTGEPQITFTRGQREVTLNMSADEALTFAEALTFFANATKRTDRSGRDDSQPSEEWRRANAACEASGW